MSDELILFQAMLNLATNYNNKDPYEWQQRKSYEQMAEEITAELNRRGYSITEKCQPTNDVKPELNHKK